MELATLAYSVTTFLIPLLPYLHKPGEKAVEEIGKKIGSDVWEGAKALWAKLRPQIEARPAALEAANDAAQAPEDTDNQAALRKELKKLFTEDEALAREVARLLDAVQAVGSVTASGNRSVAIGGSVSGSTIITGDRSR